LAKSHFVGSLWTFGNEEEERSPEVLKAHWWNTMKKVVDEHGVYFINVWFQKYPYSAH
jgi:hypothetical protein